VGVYVKNPNAPEGEGQDFFIANTADSGTRFAYDIYDIPAASISAGSESRNSGAAAGSMGCYLCGFDAEDECMEGTLRLDQSQLGSLPAAQIIGEYSGQMAFYFQVEKKHND
jgi:hypothetical protein